MKANQDPRKYNIQVIESELSYKVMGVLQVLAYLKSSHLPLAIIANFRSNKLEYRRLVNSEFLNKDIRIHSIIDSN